MNLIVKEQYFETIKCLDEQIFNLKYHKQRISKTVGLNINLEEYIYPPNNKLLKCKVIYDSDGILDIIFDVYIIKEIKTFKFIYDDKIEYKFKSINRDYINTLYNKRGDNDEIIIVQNGYITDTSIANIAIFNKNRWFTPEKTLLEGTTKNRYLEKNKILEKNITVDEFKNAQKIALMNAMIDFKII
jgi:4-amino-4-deoxychorismate lyase